MAEKSEEVVEEKCPFDECDGSGTCYSDDTDSSGNVSRGVNSHRCRCVLPDPDDYEED